MRHIIMPLHGFTSNYFNLNILCNTFPTMSHWMDRFCYPSYDWPINLLKFIGRLEGTDWILATDWSNH